MIPKMFTYFGQIIEYIKKGYCVSIKVFFIDSFKN